MSINKKTETIFAERAEAINLAVQELIDKYNINYDELNDLNHDYDFNYSDDDGDYDYQDEEEYDDEDNEYDED